MCARESISAIRVFRGSYLVVGEFRGPCSSSRADFAPDRHFRYFWRVPTWGEARAHVIWAKWPKMAYLSVVLGHPGTPRAHTWWLERSATLLTRSGWLLHLIYVFAIFGVLSTCPRGCLSEKVEKIEKKNGIFFFAFFDQKHVETSRNGIKNLKK